MGKNHLNPSLIPKSAVNTKKKKLHYIDKNVAQLEGTTENGDTHKVFMSTKFLQHKYQCFSEWTKEEMKGFWSFNENIHKATWHEIYQSSGKKGKSGFAYTKIDSNCYPNSPFKKSLSPDVTLFELRVSQKARVHGFRMKSVFFLCWLDRNHTLT